MKATPSVLPIPSPPKLCVCGLPSPHHGTPCRGPFQTFHDPRNDPVPDSSGRPRCIVKGCPNPRYRYDYGPSDYVDVPRCAKHRAEFNEAVRAHKKRKAQIKAGLLPPDPPRALLINFKIGGRNRAEIEAAAKASAMSVEEWAAHHLLWAATLPRDAKSAVAQQEADLKAEVQRCLDQLVKDGEIKIVGEQDGEKIYATV